MLSMIPANPKPPRSLELDFLPTIAITIQIIPVKIPISGMKEVPATINAPMPCLSFSFTLLSINFS